MSALAHAALAVLVGASAPSPQSVPPPRPVPSRALPYRPPPPRPVAVALTGIGMLGLACGLSLIAVGIDSQRVALDGRTEGEVHGRTKSARRLLAVGIPIAGAGLGTAIGGIVWMARDRARAKRLDRRLDRK